MSKYFNLLKFHTSVTLKTTKLLMPLVFWIISMLISYTLFPLHIVTCFLVSCITLFYIMVWLSMSYYNTEDPISEQILIFKTGSEYVPQISKILFLFCVCILMSLIGVITPAMQNAIYGPQIFTRPLLVSDLIASFFLHLFIALLGVSLGGLLQPRIMKNRKIAFLLTFMAALLSILKMALTGNYPILKYVMWILPPVSDFTNMFAEVEFFSTGEVIKIILLMLGYALAYFIITIAALRKRKF